MDDWKKYSIQSTEHDCASATLQVLGTTQTRGVPGIRLQLQPQLQGLARRLEACPASDDWLTKPTLHPSSTTIWFGNSFFS